MTKWTIYGMTLAAALAAACFGQTLPPELKAKVEARAAKIKAWGADPAIVNAVKAHNAAPPAEARGMTNEKWKALNLLDPMVRGYTRNAAAESVKSKRDDVVSEAFVSGADGGKVAFLSKPSNWSHKDKDKHRVPMSGRVWVGPVEVDDSTGAQQVQIGTPVLDGGKPIGSIVVGLAVAKLK